MPLHPVFQAALNAAQAAGRPALSAGTIAAAREAVAAGAKSLGVGPELGSVRPLTLPGRSGPVPATLYRPAGQVLGLVVYVHGGGWVAGSVEGFDALARALAARSDCAVLSVDYRLAPEHPFPAGLEDAEDAIRWAWAQRAELAVKDAALIVVGDSAGANLVTVAARALAAEIEIALQLLFYPVTDQDFDTSSYQECAEGFSLTREDMRWFFSNYAPEAQWSDPRIAPMRAPLAGSPPAWIAVAEYDVLRVDGERYAQQLKEAGVAVETRTWPSLTHGFARWFNLVDVANEAVDAAAAAIRRAASS
ncbi:MAG: alpha/beta hydrolase [Polaromonas sp.]|uniref:alpha/beta hydrolase n=1 Tax=Polaromonas sp. TaxID=1869339 RepID=UPI002488D4E9|nr:alpha/beta hydrolase [Polaromonas sp.]MDI1239987.1 alpha/beta hydrolase [Polaromonas sp.]